MRATGIWMGEALPSIEQKQKGFLLMQQKDYSAPEGLGRWIIAAKKKAESRLRVKYRDFNNNWYITTASIKFEGAAVSVGASTQDKLGSS
jgi:hypothetical protein